MSIKTIVQFSAGSFWDMSMHAMWCQLCVYIKLWIARSNLRCLALLTVQIIKNNKLHKLITNCCCWFTKDHPFHVKMLNHFQILLKMSPCVAQLNVEGQCWRSIMLSMLVYDQSDKQSYLWELLINCAGKMESLEVLFSPAMRIYSSLYVRWSPLRLWVTLT